MLRHRVSSLALLLSLLLAPWLNAFAAPIYPKQLYQIEVIIFKYITPPAGPSETWPSNPILPKISEALDLQSPPTQSSERASDAHPMLETTTAPSEGLNKLLYRYLPTAALKLSPEENLLNTNKDYQVLLHVAWLQTDGTSPLIHLKGGVIYDDQGKPIQGKFNPHQPTSSDNKTSNEPWELEGTIQVSKDQYYIVKTNLVLTDPNPSLKNSWFNSKENSSPFTHYVMKDTQRMKENELHYFDHPYYGMLIGIYRKEA